ncbi:MAG: phage scaffolding protein [Clostridia bacterium]|nr:phage scaffolding protein [Clostridia bacterium]
MKRKFLEDLGIEKENIDKILDENGRDIENAKGELETVKSELNTANNTIAERDKQLKSLKESVGNNEALTQKIADLEQKNKDDAAKHKAEMDNLKINNAIDKSLMSFKAKTPKAVKAMLDMESVKLDKDGNITGIDEQIKALSESEDTKYLFENSAPVLRGTQPGHGADDDDNSNTEKMTYSEMCAYLESNPDAKV